MDAFDPYHILGLAKDAKPGAVKAAYRSRARETHPDKGGDVETFVVIVRAFDILSDPDARRMYDETGIVDPEAAAKLRKDVAIVLADMFDVAVRTAIETGMDLGEVDFIDMMTSAVSNNAREASEVSRRLGEELAALEALKARIRRNDEKANMFAERLEDQISARSAEQAALRRRVHVFEIAVIELGNYDSEVELISALETEPVQDPR